MFQQLFQLQQNTSSLLSQVTYRIIAINDKLATLLPTAPVNSPVVTPQQPQSSILVREPNLRPL